MSDTPYPVGTTYNDDFFLSNAANPNGITGAVAASAFSYTLAANGVGNQPITGIVLSEVDSVNNPGLYHVQGSATTSFVAVAGEYTSRISYIPDRTIEFTKTSYVTSTGAMGGSTGLVSFTAIAGNGRVVTTSAVPLQGATVIVLTPAGVLYQQFTTDVNGLWGTIWFPATQTGVWQVQVVLAGYATAAFSITTTATTATGSGADVALTVITTAGILTLGSLMTTGRFQIRQNVGLAADAQLKSAINDALAMLSKEYLWSWLKTDGTVILNPFYATGTLTISGGGLTATIAGGTFPTWATDKKSKFMLNGKWYRISAQVSNTVITLMDQYGEINVGPGLGFTLFQDEYALPLNCLKIGRFWPGFTWGPPPAMVSYEMVREEQNVINTPQNYPRYAAVHNQNIVFWPYPQTAHDLRFYYHYQPATLVNLTDVADWDSMHLEVLERAMEYQLAIRYTNILAGDVPTTYQTYKVALAKAIAYDKESPHRDSMLRGGRRPTIGDRTIPSS